MREFGKKFFLPTSGTGTAWTIMEWARPVLISHPADQFFEKPFFGKI